MNDWPGGWIARSSYRKRWREWVKEMCDPIWTAVDLGTGHPFWRATTPKRITFKAFTWNPYDDDGLRSAIKPVRDGLRDAGVIHDDNPKSGHTFEYEQEVNRQRRGVEIRMERL